MGATFAIRISNSAILAKNSNLKDRTITTEDIGSWQRQACNVIIVLSEAVDVFQFELSPHFVKDLLLYFVHCANDHSGTM